jgi:hypothetical protein
MPHDDLTPILSLAGRTIARIERDPEVPMLICAYDNYGKLLFKAMSLFDEAGFSFDTNAIDSHLNDCLDHTAVSELAEQ